MSGGASSVENTPPRPSERLRPLLEAAGAPVKAILGYVGDHATMLGQSVAWLFRPPFRTRIFLEQMEFVGVGSLPIIFLVGFFSGAVSAQQAINALEIFNQERYVGATVGLSLAQELANTEHCRACQT